MTKEQLYLQALHHISGGKNKYIVELIDFECVDKFSEIIPNSLEIKEEYIYNNLDDLINKEEFIIIFRPKSIDLMSTLDYVGYDDARTPTIDDFYRLVRHIGGKEKTNLKTILIQRRKSTIYR